MEVIAFIPLIVTMAPVIILGVFYILSAVETSIREGIGQ